MNGQSTSSFRTHQRISVCTMRETLLDPIKESWGKLDAAINKNVPRYSFSINGSHDAAIEAKVHKQIAAKY